MTTTTSQVDSSSSSSSMSTTMLKSGGGGMQEQFKSTKKWHDIIDSFCANMPTKRHWRSFRSYSDCFVASDAVDLVYDFLKKSAHFQHVNLTRHNAVKVLNIFVKEKLIEAATTSGTANADLVEFQDDDRLYRFCTNHSRYMSRNVSSSSNGLNTHSTVSHNSMSNVTSASDTTTSCNNTTSYNNNNTTANSSKENLLVSVNNSTSYSDNSASVTTATAAAEKLCGSMTKQTSQRNFENVTKRERRETLTSVATSTSSNRAVISMQAEYDVWSKVARKMLESVLRKAILNTSIQQKRMPCQNRSIEQHENNNLNKKHRTGTSGVVVASTTTSPRGYSSLKRSTDIKLSLSKMLDKKSLDVLVNKVSGANICYNFVNADEHGVVKIFNSTPDDLPVWVINAMHSLLNWEGDRTKIEEEEDLPRFMDVYDEIIKYFKDLKEPLLTKDLSFLFVQILELLLINPTTNSQTPPTIKSTTTTTRSDSMAAARMTSYHDEIEYELVKNALQMSTSKSPPAPAALMVDPELKAAIVYETLSNIDSEQERIDMLRELILELVAPSPHCCYDCLQKYETMSQELSCTLKTDAEMWDLWLEINQANCSTMDSETSPTTQLEDYVVVNEDELLLSENNNKNNNDDDDYDGQDEEFELYKVRREREPDLISFSSIFFPVPNATSSSSSLAHHQQQRLINKSSQSDRKIRRNNSFRAAIGSFPTTMTTMTANSLPPFVETLPTIHQGVIKTTTTSPPNYTRNPKLKTTLNRKQTPGRVVTRSFMDKLKENRVCSRDDDNDDELVFKKPMQPMIVTAATLPKSVSMNFISSSNDLLATTNDNRKRKANNMVNSSSSESLNTFTRVGGVNHHNLKSMSTMNIAGSTNDEEMEKTQQHQLPSISLNHLNYWTSSKQQIISDLIKSTKSWNNLTTRQFQEEDVDELERQVAHVPVVTLQTKISHDLLSFIVDILRLLVFMLPPTNKRKLHFLLRFLYKFKQSRSVSRHLLVSNGGSNNKSQSSPSYLESLVKDVNYIDSSIGSANKTIDNLSPTTTASSPAREVEQKLIETFLTSVVFIEDDNDDTSSSSSSIKRQLSSKLVQILINKHAQIMKTPQELAQNVKAKLERGSSSSSVLKPTQVSNSSQKSSSNQAQLVVLLEEIIKDPKMDEREKASRLKQLKDVYPNILEEHARLKKAMNILGLNETIAIGASGGGGDDLAIESKSSTETTGGESYSKKKIFLANLTNSIKSRHLSSTLNHTTMANSTSNHDHHHHKQSGIQRLFVKKKKENLI